MGSDAFIPWPALYCDWLLDANIEDGLIGGTLDVRADRPNAADHAGAEIFLDTLDRVGAVALRNKALNWTPCVRSLLHEPLA